MESEGEFTMMSTRSVNNLQPSKEGNHAPQIYSARAQNYQRKSTWLYFWKHK